MSELGPILNRLAALALAAVVALPPAAGAAAGAQDLLDRLQKQELPNWKQVEKKIRQKWSQSGSPAMDLLLRRGREALQAGEPKVAIEHLTALTDHAPGFAEGWYVRAKAYTAADLYGPAMHDLEVALNLNPRHFGALVGMGSLLEEAGRPAEALSAYRAAAIINPHEPRIAEAIERLESAGHDIPL